MTTTRLKLAVALTALYITLGTIQCPALLLLYQGHLRENNLPANGLYEMTTQFFDTNGNPVGIIASNMVTVADGLFTLQLDATSFEPLGTAHDPIWLELSLRRSDTSNDFTKLSPRQEIGATPYALYAESAATANSVAFSNVTSWPDPVVLIATGALPISALNTSNATPGQIFTFDGTWAGWKDPVIRTGAVTTVTLADGSVTAPKVAAGQLLKSLNGLHDAVNLTVSGGLTLNASGNTLEIAGLDTGDCNTFSNCYWNLLGNGNLIPGVNFLGTVAGELAPLEFRVNNQRALRIKPASVPNVVGGHVNNDVLDGFSGGAIGGGEANLITNNMAVIGGGEQNLAGGLDSSVSGGARNRAIGTAASIGGGDGNLNQGSYSSIAGGNGNFIGPDVGRGTIGGGYANMITNGQFSTIGGGEINIAGAPEATVGGGDQNWALGFASTIAGGQENIAAGDFSTVAGGYLNGAYAKGAVAVGGGGFPEGGNKAVANWSTVVGGYNNQAWGTNSFIGGGAANLTSNNFSVLAGGFANRASGNYSTVPGGRENVASGSDSFAAGRRAKATNDSTFVWNDSSAGDFGSTFAGQFLVSAKGGVGFNVNNPTIGGVTMQGNGITVLELRSGGLKITGAGVNTHTIAFTHRAGAATISGHITTINNNLTDGRPDAILLVTHNFSKDTATDEQYETHPVGVWYDAGKWKIFHEDFAPMPEGRAFNVMVMNP